MPFLPGLLGGGVIGEKGLHRADILIEGGGGYRNPPRLTAVVMNRKFAFVGIILHERAWK